MKKYNYFINTCRDCNSKCNRTAKRCRKCQDKRRAKLITGKNNPNYKDGRTKSKLCSYCKEKYIDYRNNKCQSCENKIRFKYKTYEDIMDKEKARKLKLIRRKNLLGLKRSKETKKKISLSKGGTGVPYELTEYGAGFDNALKEQVRFRDKYKCQICDCSQLENGRQLDVHHIDYNKENNVINNLIALCMSCHRKINVNRDYWTEKLSIQRRKQWIGK